MPSISQLGKKIRTTYYLTTREKSEFALSWGMLLLVDLGLRFLPFNRIQQLLNNKQAMQIRTGKADSENPENQTIDRISRVVMSASRNHFHPMSCLRRALVLQWMLKRQGIHTELRFGVRTEEEDLKAHAWLERNGNLISEPEVVAEKFVRLRGIEQ